MEERLDKILIQRGLISTRVRAEKMILETGVKVAGKLINKPGKKFPVDIEIEMLAEEIPWVSRGAFKLIHALDNWNFSVAGLTAMDLGASTGGFTEVLLSRDIAKVYCVDVGTNQLHPSIKSNPNVLDISKTHIRELTKHQVPELVDLVVIDVSFISLEKVITLVKPQFEVGKENISKGGIVKNQQLYPTVIENIKKVSERCNLEYQAHIDSPILGGDGNKEFLMWLTKKPI